LSDVELQLRAFEESEDAARQLIKIEPNGLRGAYALAQVFDARGEHRRVIETLEPVITAARRRDSVPRAQLASLLSRVASAYESLQDLDRAIASYREALEVTPNDLGLDITLIQIYLEADRLSDAMDAVRAAQRRHPDQLSLLRLEADVLAGQGDVDGGAAVLRRAIALRENEPMAHVVLSEFYAEHRQVDEAVRVLEAAQLRFPQSTLVLFQLGAVLERGERFDAAEEKFREVIEREPENAAALNYLGYMLADRGDRLEESVDLLLKALAIEPDNGSYLDSLGWAYYKLNRLDLAEAPLRQASDQLRENSVVQDHLGDLLYKLGRYDEAIAAWEGALAGDRDSVDPDAIEQKIRDARQR
jgi:tetratricopeptide (TPR) repeat protein